MANKETEISCSGRRALPWLCTVIQATRGGKCLVKGTDGKLGECVCHALEVKSHLMHGPYPRGRGH